jgi:predicted RNase H-like HicB family nuclease
MNTNSLEDLKAVQYPVKIEYDDEDALFVAEFPDLPGCSAPGSTVSEAYDAAQRAKSEWLRVTLEQGLPVPKPSKARDYSGRILVRIPASLHATLADRARINGASLNQYIVHLLSASALGEQVNSKLDAVTGRLQEIECRIAAGFNLPGTLWRGTDRSEIYGWQTPKYQAIAGQNATVSSARESARLQ